MNSTTPTPAGTISPAKHELLHSRLADGPAWLAGLLRHKEPSHLSDAEAAFIRTQIIEYADKAADTEGVRPIADLVIRDGLLQQFDDWCHNTARLDYQEYLRTDGWERTRSKVLGRAHHVCEGCGERRATQVHHLNYEDPRGEEMLFNLVALCSDCHEKVSARQKAGG